MTIRLTRRTALASAAALAGLAAAGCDRPVQRNILRRGNIAEPGTLDPHKWQLAYEVEIMNDLFEPPLINAPDGTVMAGAAEMPVISDGGLVWTFTLREGLVWSDGAPLTAEDYLAGIRRAFDPRTAAPSVGNLLIIRNGMAVNRGEQPLEALGVEAPDARTLRITLERPSPTLYDLMTGPIAAPLPRHAYARHGADWVRPGTMVSNGAYMFAEWRPNDVVRVVKNPRYRDAANVAFDEVHFFPTDDDAAALRRFRNGELDLNNRFPQSQIDWLRENMPDAVRIAPAFWLNYLVFNVRDGLMADIRLRRALSMAIDRETITETLTRTGENPAYRIVPTAQTGYREKTGLDFRNLTMAERIDTARSLLAEAGFGPGKPLAFTFRHRAGEINRRIAVALQAAWAEIGAACELSQADVATHYNMLRTRDFTVADAGFSTDPDPEYMLWLLDSRRTEINYAGYADPAFDAALDRASTIFDKPERFAAMAEAEDIGLRAHAMAPLFFFNSRNLVSPALRGWATNGPDLHRSQWMSFGAA